MLVRIPYLSIKSLQSEYTLPLMKREVNHSDVSPARKGPGMSRSRLHRWKRLMPSTRTRTLTRQTAARSPGDVDHGDGGNMAMMKDNGK